MPPPALQTRSASEPYPAGARPPTPPLPAAAGSSGRQSDRSDRSEVGSTASLVFDNSSGRDSTPSPFPSLSHSPRGALLGKPEKYVGESMVETGKARNGAFGGGAVDAPEADAEAEADGPKVPLLAPSAGADVQFGFDDVYALSSKTKKEGEEGAARR